MIVIDAPDECQDEEPESVILLVPGMSVPRLPESNPSSPASRRRTLWLDSVTRC